MSVLRADGVDISLERLGALLDNRDLDHGGLEERERASEKSGPQRKSHSTAARSHPMSRRCIQRLPSGNRAQKSGQTASRMLGCDSRG